MLFSIWLSLARWSNVCLPWMTFVFINKLDYISRENSSMFSTAKINRIFENIVFLKKCKWYWFFWALNLTAITVLPTFLNLLFASINQDLWNECCSPEAIKKSHTSHEIVSTLSSFLLQLVPFRFIYIPDLVFLYFRYNSRFLLSFHPSHLFHEKFSSFLRALNSRQELQWVSVKG